jgi:hypothetical protein
MIAVRKADQTPVPVHDRVPRHAMSHEGCARKPGFMSRRPS